MPKVRQPASLQTMSMDTLIEFVVRFYDRIGAANSSANFRDGISAIKAAVCNRIPWQYLAEFCTRFLDELTLKERDEAMYEAALEIIMDLEIIGLRCRGQIFKYLDPQDGHRFQKPVELDFSNLQTTIYCSSTTSLATYHLNDLTTFIFPRYCTNSELTVIGNNCSKLEVLKVPSSRITDKGLRALNRCGELRVVDIAICREVTPIGVNHLLSVHRKLEELSFGSRSLSDIPLHVELDISSPSGSAVVCPSMKSICIHDVAVENEYLSFVVKKFPNLTSFGIKDSAVGDLAILASLDKLEAIDLNFGEVDSMHLDANISDIEQTWQCLQVLLSIIGANIKILKFCCWDQGFFWHQEGLNYIFQSCPDLEQLTFDHGCDTLVIPQFKKLKELVPFVPINFESSDIIGPPVIEFEKLSNLESLTLIDFGVSFETVKSIMLDEVKFPKLTELTTDCLTDEEVREIERIAKSRNFDFKLTNLGTISWYSEIMYPK